MEDFLFEASIRGQKLDNYLANGWYRMGELIFTTRFIALGDDGSRGEVFWLRYKVAGVKPGKRVRDIVRMNAGFSVSFRPYAVSFELLKLHFDYAQSLGFANSPDLRDKLGKMVDDVYDSQLVEVRDGSRLIAAGIFDKGQNSIAGIINIYDPQYSRYSLGKYLMYLKYQYCISNGIDWYYPGYISFAYPVFNYKLFLDKGAAELMNNDTREWIRYDQRTV